MPMTDKPSRPHIELIGADIKSCAKPLNAVIVGVLKEKIRLWLGTDFAVISSINHF